MSRVERPVHVAPARPTEGLEHRGDGGSCRCEPLRARDLLVPGRVVWLHRPLPEADVVGPLAPTEPFAITSRR